MLRGPTALAFYKICDTGTSVAFVFPFSFFFFICSIVMVLYVV